MTQNNNSEIGADDSAAIPAGPATEPKTTAFLGRNSHSDNVTPEESVHLCKRYIKKLIDDDFHFVFFWGLPAVGKTTILYTLWLCMERLGILRPLEYENSASSRQGSFRYQIDRFVMGEPAARTNSDNAYALLAAFTPEPALHEKLPTVKFAFIEAAGETTARQYNHEIMIDEASMGDFPLLHNVILSNENAKVLHVVVAAFSDKSDFDVDQDSNLTSALNLVERKRRLARKADEFLLVISKWDLTFNQEPSYPEEWLQSNLPRTFHRYKAYNQYCETSYFQTYSTGEWTIATTESGLGIQYLTKIRLEAAECLIHWLYRASTGYLLFPNKEPLPPPQPSKSELIKQAFKRFFTI